MSSTINLQLAVQSFRAGELWPNFETFSCCIYPYRTLARFKSSELWVSAWITSMHNVWNINCIDRKKRSKHCSWKFPSLILITLVFWNFLKLLKYFKVSVLLSQKMIWFYSKVCKNKLFSLFTNQEVIYTVRGL